MTTVQHEILIEGESFRIEREHGLIYLTHPKWSLTGAGKTLLDAEMDMRYSASIVFPIYQEAVEKGQPMTHDAYEMYAFMLKVMVSHLDEDNCKCFMCSHKDYE